MKFSKKYKILFILLSLWSVALLASLYSYKEYRVQQILDSQLKLSQISYKSAYEYYKLLASNIHKFVIHSKSTMEILEQLKDADAEQLNLIREKLHLHMKKSFLNLNEVNFTIFHFHLKDNHSFLRMHRPSKYGDDLTHIRYGIATVNKTLKPIDGFEEGRIIPGFRFIYPIIDENKNHLGSVELSASPKGFIYMLHKNQITDVHFLVKKSIIDEKVWSEELNKYYKDSEESSNYYLEKNAESNTGDYSKHSHFKFLLNDQALRAEIAKSMNEKKTFALYFNKQIVSFFAIGNIEGDDGAAYFVSYEDSTSINDLSATETPAKTHPHNLPSPNKFSTTSILLA